MPKTPPPRWWEARRAQNRKPATYRCPLCGQLLPALSEHMLLFPEGDHGRRRHAHTACVLRAREAGKLPTRREWERAQRPDAEDRPGLWGRLARRLRSRDQTADESRDQTRDPTRGRGMG